MNLYLFLITAFLISGNLTEQFSSNRQLYIFGKEKNQLLVQQQLQLLNAETDAVMERDIKIIVVEKENQLYQKYALKTAQFTVILIGKDGTEKYRTEKLLQTKELFALIDAMPMRKAELQKKDKNNN